MDSEWVDVFFWTWGQFQAGVLVYWRIFETLFRVGVVDTGHLWHCYNKVGEVEDCIATWFQKQGGSPAYAKIYK